MKERYDYKGYEPYGAAQMHIMDNFTELNPYEDNSACNVTEMLVEEGYKFEIIDNENAVLHLGNLDIDFVNVTLEQDW